MFSSPGEILFHFGPFQIRWYGFLIAIAFLLCTFIAGRLAEKKYDGISESDISNFGIAAIVGGLIGARLWFVILNYQYFSKYPMESFQIWLGGQSIQGGLLGAVLGTLLYEYFSKKIRHIKFSLKDKSTKETLKTWWNLYLAKLSIAATVVPLGQAIGRWGNFFNEEAYGSETSLPWALYVKASDSFHHPTFLYESIWCLIMFFILLKIFMKLKPLQIIASYLFLYSIVRLFLEQIRTDSLYIGNFKAATLVSIVTLLISFVLFLSSRKKDT